MNLTYLICPVPINYVERPSPAFGPAVLRWGNDVASLPPQDLTQQSSLITRLASNPWRACQNYDCTVHITHPCMANLKLNWYLVVFYCCEANYLLTNQTWSVTTTTKCYYTTCIVTNWTCIGTKQPVSVNRHCKYGCPVMLLRCRYLMHQNIPIPPPIDQIFNQKIRCTAQNSFKNQQQKNEFLE